MKPAILRAAWVEMAILASGKDSKLFGFDFRSERNFNPVATSGIDDKAVITVDQTDTESSR